VQAIARGIIGRSRPHGRLARGLYLPQRASTLNARRSLRPTQSWPGSGQIDRPDVRTSLSFTHSSAMGSPAVYGSGGWECPLAQCSTVEQKEM
jgi:hypothetical protein